LKWTAGGVRDSVLELHVVFSTQPCIYSTQKLLLFSFNNLQCTRRHTKTSVFNHTVEILFLAWLFLNCTL